MSSLQPLYDVKERLEYAAMAGTGLLEEDFRLRRAAEAMAPLAAASPVFKRISAGLEKLLSASPEERPGQLLDVLGLVDAVAYTQGGVGVSGELEALPAGGGSYQEISYGQIQPLLHALTSTGGGRMEIIQSTWEAHPEYFTDFRVLPAVVAGLGDGYGEIGELNAKILKSLGSLAVPLLKQGFDPAGKKEMARRVETIAAVEGAEAVAWLRAVLPEAKKDVRVAVLLALGNDPGNTALLLDLEKTERSGGNREAVLASLARQDGDAVAAFWAEELKKNSGSVRFLQNTDGAWASELIASGLREQLENMLSHGGCVPEEEQTELSGWCQAVGKKDSPAMLDFWRWADERMEVFDGFTNQKGNPVFIGVRLTDTLRECMCLTGPGPLREFCLELFDRRPEMTRYLHISFLAAVLSRPASEVYEKYGPYIQTRKPLLDVERKKTLHTVLFRALDHVWWFKDKYFVLGSQPAAQPLDIRWIERMTRAVWADVQGSCATIHPVYWEDVGGLDRNLMKKTNPADEEIKKILIPYARRRMAENGQPYTYSRWLLYMGASPRGVLGKALARKPNNNRGYAVWQLLYDAYQVLPREETVALLEEVLADGAFQKQTAPHMQKAIPWTIEQLQAGRDFPSSAEWTKL